MARRKLRKIRFERKHQRGSRPRQRKTKAVSEGSPAQASQLGVMTHQELVSKLIALSVPSARDAQKTAHRIIANVFSAIRHVLTEGDLIVPDFGRFKAAKHGKTGDIQIRFTPDEKLKHAVEARLKAVS